MDPEEQELQGDAQYQAYKVVIEKALRNFESSSEWPDLISSLGKLAKALQSELKYSLLPKRLILCKRLAQCLHPALPSGVHLKALETYEVIFKIIGTKWLAKDLFIYSSGLFPLLGHAAMSVRPVLLKLYERYFLPLQRALLPSLQAFVTGLLPGLEEGLEVYDRTDALMVKLSLLVGQELFYSALWSSLLISPLVRLPASFFIVSHFDRMGSGHEQRYMLGSNHTLVRKSVYLSLQDSNVLVQRNTLEILLFFLPLCTCLDPAEGSIPITREDVVTIMSAALFTLLRRDLSLNRRIYAWLLGTDFKGGMVAADAEISTSLERHATFYFDKYSREFLIQALINILEQKKEETGPKSVMDYLRPLRIIITLLDRPEIGAQVAGDLMLEVVRALYRYLGGAPLSQNSSVTWDQVGSKPPEDRNAASEIVKTLNVLIKSLGTEYLWDYMSEHFQACLSTGDSGDPTVSAPPSQAPPSPAQAPPSISELSTLIAFLLDVIPLELYPDIQMRYLPQMLVRMLRALQGHMTTLSLTELTQGLSVCSKVLSKIQTPVAYAGLTAETPGREESGSPAQAVQEGEEQEGEVENEEDEAAEEEPGTAVEDEEEEEGEQEELQEEEQEELQKEEQEELQEEEQEMGAKDPVLPPPQQAERGGLDFAAPPFEPNPLQGVSEEGPGACPERDNVWRRGGSVENIAECVQDILASFIARHLLNLAEEPGAAGQGEGQEPRQSPPLVHKQTQPGAEGPSGDRESQGPEGPDWGEGFAPRDSGEISEACCRAFSAACHLLLECTTFPLYLSEDEMEGLCNPRTVQNTGNVKGTLPLWLRSLMTCCLSEDHHIQQVAMSSMLELVGRSQSLVLLTEDRNQRYKSSGHNPFCGQLQMVTAPPISPAVLAVIADRTDFYQRVAQVLWGQLDVGCRELHIACVELFYRLHCLAPSTAVCENIICQDLLHGDKTVRMEALHKFSVLWHLTRDIQTNVNMLLNRSFDRSLFVVLDNLTNQDGSVSVAGQSWLVRALSLNDVVRVLEPVLLILLHPRTQRSSIQWVKQNLTVDNLQQLNCRMQAFSGDSGRSADAVVTDDQSEESLLTWVTVVDREALWAELESVPETAKMAAESPGEVRTENEEVEGEGREQTAQGDAIDGQLCFSSLSSLCPLQEPECEDDVDDTTPSGPGRADSAPALGSEFLWSDDEDLEQEATAHLRLLSQGKEKREALESLFRDTLLYLRPYDSARVLHALSVLETLLRTCATPFLEAACSTPLDPGHAHLRLICSLTQRHLEAQEGRSFNGPLPLQTQPRPPAPLVELLTCLCLQFMRSYYPCYLSVTPRDLSGNRDVQVKSAEVLALLMRRLAGMAGVERGGWRPELVRALLWGCGVQRHALLALCASMHVTQRPGGAGPGPQGAGLLEEGGGVSEENLLNLDGGGPWGERALQTELLKLLQVLIALEHRVWPGGAGGEAHEGVSPLGWEGQATTRSLQYVQTRPLPAQALLVSAAARALQPHYGYALHGPWVALISTSLPYLGSSLAAVSAPFVAQICRNLDELVSLHQSEAVMFTQSWSLKRENIAPDYPLTLLEGLTTIAHYCLLDNRKASVAPSPADVHNAREALLDELPQMLGTMAMLWGVVKREETQRGASDSVLGCSRNSSTSVYFKSTKILREKVLEFLNPLAVQYGVRVVASVGAVWGNHGRGHGKNKILLVASEFHQTVVDLIQSLSMLSTNSILQLVKEVVRRKPHRTKGDQKPTQVDVPMLQFTYTFIQGVPAESLQESVSSILCLLKECVLLSLPPQGHFLLLGILSDFVIRFPNLDNKKDTRDLQEVTHRVLGAVSGVVGSSLEQTSWLRRSLEVKAQPQASPPEGDLEHGDFYDSDALADDAVSCSVQALTLLAEVLAPLLDVVFHSDEKDKAVPLIARLMEYVFPYLKNHSAHNAPAFCTSAALLCSLSGYAYTKRAWKHEAFDLFMDPLFFRMHPSCIAHWGSVIDHLLTYEKTMFKDLTSMQSSSLKLFPNYEQKAMLLKRQAFAMFSGELDQYCLYLPLIQERLTESLRVGQASMVMAQIFLLFRVLLLRISPQHLTSLWPIMVTELIHVFVKLEKALMEGQDVSRNPGKGRGAQGTRDRNGPAQRTRERNRPALLLTQSELEMYLSACKFLDATLCFPPERIPLFQMYRWAFVPEVDVDSYSGPGNSIMEGEQECRSHVVRVLEGLHCRFGELNGSGEHSCQGRLDFPLLTQRSISSVTQLEPFFRVLSVAPKGPCSTGCPQSMANYVAHNSRVILSRLEEMIQRDFLEDMES